jgi:sugar (pentulose or hexulose) kinase
MTQEHTRADLLRAVYEGVALSVRDGFDVIPAPVESIRLSGGGAKSAFWSQMIADCTGRQVIVPAGSEFGARGAAALGAVALEWYPTVTDAVSIYRDQGRVFTPQPDSVRLYDTLFQRYTRLRQHLDPFWSDSRR